MKYLTLIILLSLLSCKERKQEPGPAKDLSICCDCVIPKGFALLYNKNTGDYIVKTGKRIDYVASLAVRFGDVEAIPGDTVYADGYYNPETSNVRYPVWASMLSGLGHAFRIKDSCRAKFIADSMYKDAIQKEIQAKQAACNQHIADSIQHIKDSINNDFKPVAYPKKHIIFDSLLSDGIYAVHISDSEVLKTYKQVKDQAENQFR
jgi:hypothetical protein